MSDLIIEKTIHAPINQVFAALTDPDAMSEWFIHRPGGSAQIQINPVPGGEFTFTLRHPESADLEATGVFVEVSPPRRLVFTWNTHLTHDSLVIIDLQERGESTLITLRHRLPDQLKPPHRQAWNEVLSHLRSILEAQPDGIDTTSDNPSR